MVFFVIAAPSGIGRRLGEATRGGLSAVSLRPGSSWRGRRYEATRSSGSIGSCGACIVDATKKDPRRRSRRLTRRTYIVAH